MKTNTLKIFALATLMIFLGAGVSLSDDRKGDKGKGGHGYDHKDRDRDVYSVKATEKMITDTILDIGQKSRGVCPLVTCGR